METYLKTKNQDTLLVYFERNTLFFKIGTQSGWTHPQIIAEQVNPSFALSQYNNEIFLLYSTRLGELYIIRTKDFVQWDRKQISIEKRDLRKITVEDCVTADAIFEKLMGDEVEPRRKCIEENAGYVQNLDI